MYHLMVSHRQALEMCLGVLWWMEKCCGTRRWVERFGIFLQSIRGLIQSTISILDSLSAGNQSHPTRLNLLLFHSGLYAFQAILPSIKTCSIPVVPQMSIWSLNLLMFMVQEGEGRFGGGAICLLLIKHSLPENI